MRERKKEKDHTKTAVCYLFIMVDQVWVALLDKKKNKKTLDDTWHISIVCTN